MATDSSRMIGSNSLPQPNKGAANARGDGHAPMAGRSGFEKMLLGVYVGIAIALLLPLVSLASWMLGRDYYQHFPILLLAAGALAGYRLRATSLSWESKFTVRVAVWTILAIALTVTVFVLPSRWMASLAVLCLFAAVINFAGGRRLAALLFGPMLLLVAAVPLPVGFDNWFVVALQNLATRLASYWLELAGVMHFTTGVSIAGWRKRRKAGKA